MWTYCRHGPVVAERPGTAGGSHDEVKFGEAMYPRAGWLYRYRHDPHGDRPRVLQLRARRHHERLGPRGEPARRLRLHRPGADDARALAARARDGRGRLLRIL